MRVISLLLILLLSSCSCDYHMRRIKAKCDDFSTTQTVTLRDTVKINVSKTDTVFKYFQKDTVIIREGRLTMKYFYNNRDSTVFLNGKCDSVVKVIERQVEKTVYKPDWFSENKWWILLAVVILLVVSFIFKR